MNKDKTTQNESGQENHKLQNEDYTAPPPEKEGRTEVANAHASGLGAMGRNDEKLPTGEEAPGPQGPAY